MNKKLIAVIVGVVVLIGAMLGVYALTRPETAQGSKTITVTIVHSDGQSKDFTIKTDAEYLAEVLLAEELVTGSDSEYGLTVESADGETADWTADGAYWAVYIGEEYATTGVSAIPVTDGGVYKLVYEAI